jgi:chemosensory pili system protein ChpC
MNAVVETVRSLWVPLKGVKLLVPNVAIAEVINHQPIDVISDGPEWLLGALRWREQELPVVSLEGLLGVEAPQTRAGARISVFNTVKSQTDLPFFAALTAGIPSLFNADADTLGESLSSGKDLPDTVADCVKAGEDEALIPQLEAIQTLIEDAWTDCRR